MTSNKQELAQSPTGADWIPICLILLLATVLRLYQLSTESVWVDEMLSISDTESLDLTEPNIRPFYFILLRVWMLFGSSDVWLRGLSVLFGLGSIFLTYQLGRRLMGRQTGLIAALVMTLSPLFINHAQEIRMYTLSIFLSLAGTLALAIALEKAQDKQNPSIKSLVGWSLARAAAILTTPINIVLLLPDMILFGWKARQFRNLRRALLGFGCGLLFIGVVFLPPALLLTFGGLADDFYKKQVSNYSKPGAVQVVGMLVQVVAYWPLRYLLESNQILLDNSKLGDSSLLSSVLTAKALPLLYYGMFTLVLFALLGLALVALLKEERSESLRWVAAWAFLPISSILFISYVKNSIWFPRYLLSFTPYFLILLAAGLTIVWHWQRGLAIVVAVAYFVAVGGGLHDYYTTLYRNDWQGAAQTISANEQPGDVIVFYSINRLFDQSLPRYYQGSIPIQLINKPKPAQPQTSDQPAKPQPFDRSYIEQELGQLPSAESRLWVVCWPFCKKDRDRKNPNQIEPEIDQIFQTVAGEGFQIQKQETFESMEIHPIKVFLVTPGPGKAEAQSSERSSGVLSSL